METHALDYAQDMPEVLILPGKLVHIRSTISLPGSQGTASVAFHAVPFQNDDFPGQWFHGFRLDLDVHLLQQYVYSELLAAAREQAAAISKKLRVAQCDFGQTHIEVKGPVPSTIDASLVRLEYASADETVQHTDGPLGTHEATSRAAAPRLPYQQADRTLRVQSTEDQPPFTLPDGTEGETTSPANDIPSPPLSVPTNEETPGPSQRIERERHSSVGNAPPLGISMAPDGTTTPLHSSIHQCPPATNEAGLTSSSIDKTQLRSLVSDQPSAPVPSLPYSTDLVSQANQAGCLAGLTPLSPLLESTSTKSHRVSQDTLAAVSRKRKRRNKSLVNLEVQQDSSSVNIAAKISNAIRLGGHKYKPSNFETWGRDLWLLNPDRAKLTLVGLLTRQRTFTEALLCQGIVARIIHAWCLIVYEHHLSTVDRSKSIRRSQKEVRLSLRCRKLGILFLEIINKLFAHPAIGIDAYKVSPAIAAAVSVEEPFPVPNSYRDLSVSRLKVIACFVVRDLVADSDKSWTKINIEHALDPAAQVSTSDSSYENTCRALGLEATPLLLITKTVNPSACTQAGLLDELPDDGSCEKTIATADMDSLSTPAVDDHDLCETSNAGDDTILATSVQGFDLDDSMETSAWEWSKFVDFSPANDQYSPGNES